MSCQSLQQHYFLNIHLAIIQIDILKDYTKNTHTHNVIQFKQNNQNGIYLLNCAVIESSIKYNVKKISSNIIRGSPIFYEKSGTKTKSITKSALLYPCLSYTRTAMFKQAF